MAMSSFAQRVQTIMGTSVPKTVDRGEWHGKKYDHIYRDLSLNFIDGKAPLSCSMKGDLTRDVIKYHPGARHMNSSQVMCISFFKKFFENKSVKHEALLLSVLRSCGIELPEDAGIVSAAFEYEPDRSERTNFDFYIRLDDGTNISFEIKYTESEFGGISPDANDPDKYDRKWKSIYSHMMNASPYLDLGMEAFYDNYQINRNIVFAGKNDWVIFITPRRNCSPGIEAGRRYIESLEQPRIRNINWEELALKTLEAVSENKDLFSYYRKFNKKYIDILDLV